MTTGLPTVFTPEQVAEHIGWSERKQAVDKSNSGEN